ncbi:MAG: leucine--tRNA ligase [Candidatus Levybacteria bacterium CG_4_10_14_0_2_um_filter_36_16]|nr:MAG: hypothetical protein AUK12_02430 [Candidatus Levybacteria bacterium CG2_30_37_29]PIZ97529.1 MAG: leucine--tRNA ligase [Candidatus Levybacteria bacterium CG_4_10_14_0_2_um_filter_36_16]
MKKDKNYYNHSLIEPKWQKSWEEKKLFSPDLKNAKNPYYNLMMFPYPSAEGLHVGNMYTFTGADVYARFNRMQGKDVFEPIGLDGFGIHSENYALKVGRHPREQAEISEKNFYRQLRAIGNSFDWTRTLETYDPNYYKWTQWLFVQLFKAGLAYRKKAEVNWCPSCKTVLSDEQVIVDKCERCSSTVEKRELEQWFFRITAYAERLLNNLEKLDWTEKIKIAQKNWIGRSQGCLINFQVVDLDCQIKVFTTRPDTLFGSTFLVLSPEHPICQKIDQKDVKDYVRKAHNISDNDRITEGKEKTGVFSGLYAINPVNSEKIPIWIADYVLMGYGTGAIMAVPAHDQRDYEFAKKYNLPIRQVIAPVSSSKYQVLSKKEEILNAKYVIHNTDIVEAYAGDGKILNSGEWSGWEVPKDMDMVIDWIEKKGFGKREVTFHLRDWLISRQRYWGPPIPMIYCKACHDAGRSWFTENKAALGEREVSSSKYQVLSKKEEILNTKYIIHNTEMNGWYPVLDENLPVLLPDVEDWKPRSASSARSGLANKTEGPLSSHPEFYETKCPKCGVTARRETDVSDTFLDSAWYFLRYTSVDTESVAFDRETVKKWLPVNMYIGGAEHAVLHLLYSRFITMVLNDLKFVDFDEPFTKLFAHGLIIKDGAKMSKSRGNVVIPDGYIKKYGADTLRMYLMFIGPFNQGGDFSDSGIEGMNRFLKKVWRLLSEAQISNLKFQISNQIPNDEFAKLDTKMHRTIKDITEDIQNFKYNTSIARLMEYYNVLFDFYTKYKIPASPAGRLDTKYCKTLVLLLAPFAPHMTEELWQRLKIKDLGLKNEEKNHQSAITNHKSIHVEAWPTFDEKYLVEDTVTIVIQVNGKKRSEFIVNSSQLKDEEKLKSQAQEIIKKYIEGKTIKKTIYVQGKILNFVV